MSESTVHLVRHGEVENPDHVVYAGLPGFGLSRRGRVQAAAAGTRLCTAPVDRLVCSPLLRARETAEAIAARCRIEIEVDDALTEWRLAGRWAATPWHELGTRFPGELEAYLEHPDDLDFTPEPLRDLAARMVAVVEGRAGDGTTVLVSHQDPIQAVRLALTGRPIAGLQHDKPGHCSIITLAGHPGEWREIASWEPPQGNEFPPVTTEA